MNTVEITRVWVRSLGNACRVRVEGVHNAEWLVDRLARTSALEGLDSVDLQPHGSICTFEIPNSIARTLASLETELAQMPGVELMLEPESD